MNIFRKYSKTKIIIKIYHAKSKIWKEIIYLFTLKTLIPNTSRHIMLHAHEHLPSLSLTFHLIHFFIQHINPVHVPCPVHTFQSKVCLPKYNCKNYDNNNDTIIFQQYKSTVQLRTFKKNIIPLLNDTAAKTIYFI